MNCINCNSETSNEKFCSLSCSAAFNNKKHPKRKAASERMCMYCRNIKSTKVMKGRVCNDCRKEQENKKLQYRNTTIGEMRTKYESSGVHRSWWYSEIRKLAKTMNRHREKKCQICGYDKHINYAHVKPISKFSDSVTLEEINKESNIMILCPNHHWEFDHNLL